MTEKMDLWLKDLAPPYALLRIALGLNIACMASFDGPPALQASPDPWCRCSRRRLCPYGLSTASAACCQLSRR